MDGISEKINDILGNHADYIRKYKEEEEKLINSINFFSEHNFQEEKRIALLKHNAMGRILYDYKVMFDDIQKAIDNWNS